MANDILKLRQQSRPVWLQIVWPVCVGTFVVSCCVLALAWQAHKHALSNAKLQNQDPAIAKMWREAAEQLVASLQAELRGLNTNYNHAAFEAGQASIGATLAKLTNITALASIQAVNQSPADTLKFQTQVADLVASLRQTFQQSLAEATSQSRADTAKLQTQVAEVAASHQALLGRLSAATNVTSLALELPGIRMKPIGNSLLITFDDGLFLHGTTFKPGAKSRLKSVVTALAQAPRPLRIEVIGCADDDRVFKKWTARFEESLSLSRASAVVDYFIELGLLEPRSLAALTSGGAERPFPSDTVQNRAKNRTAVLRVSAEEKPVEAYNSGYLTALWHTAYP
jgi:flagellar motor protein MotB